MGELLTEKEQIDCWCELQFIPMRNKKIQKPFRHFPKGTLLVDCMKWVVENGPYNSMQLDYEFLIRPAPSDEGKFEHPYLKYRGVAFQIEPFIEMTKKYPGNFTKYCEIVMTDNGLIYLAAPSHAYMEERLARRGFTNLCSIWYNMAMCQKLTIPQKKAIEELKKAGLLSSHFTISDGKT